MGTKKKVTILSVLIEILATLKALGAILVMTKTTQVFDKAVAEAGRFINISGGWIKDTQTGRGWGPSSDKSMKWEEEKKFCVDQGGRLPNVTELFSLVDRTKQNPATLIPGMKSEWYGTCEAVAWGVGGAWCVGFGYGGVGTSGKDYYSYVRPVRSSQ